jgi:hypothetical protein
MASSGKELDSMSHRVCAFAFFVCCLPAPLWAADLETIDRQIGSEPEYRGQPKYCLVVFGPEAGTRVWLVLDGDTLYVDRNANGDLTDDGDPLKPETRPGDKRPDYPFAEIRMFPRIDQIATVADRKYTRFEVGHTTIKPEFTPRNRHNRELKARFEQDPTFTRAGITVYLDDNTQVQCVAEWADTAAQAPICRIDGPLTMAPLARQELLRGDEPADVQFVVGFRGLAADGPESSFAIIDYTTIPEDVEPTAEFTFAHRDADRPPIVVPIRLTRC